MLTELVGDEKLLNGAPGITEADFSEILFLKSLNNIVDPSHKTKVTQDMSQPLAAYLAFSSHNTYLVGHQLKGESSAEMYRKVLEEGCRCVELDCWDGPQGEPRITHGYTLTTDLSFRSALTAIKGSAFTRSPYPVVLSLEMHCTKPQQESVARIISEILGSENVYHLPADIETTTDMALMTFPSPEALKNKFVIKCKTKRRMPAALLAGISEEEFNKRLLKMQNYKIVEEGKASDS